jgi:hypothetical protein
VSTRKLIVAALVCGLAILLAGGIQLFRISDSPNRAVDVLREGQSATVGRVALSVTRSSRTGEAIDVDVQFAAAPSEISVPITSFTLLVGGKLEQPTNSEATGSPGCGSTVIVRQTGLTCVVHFPPHDGTATLAFSRAGEQQLWRLMPDS